MLELIRSHKILGIAVVDMIGSFAVTYLIGGKFGMNQIFSGLMSIPIGIVTHMVMGIDTPLTEFFKSDSPHKYHGLFVGLGASLLSKIFTETITSANIGLVAGIASTLYMKEYGHNLPSSVNKQLMRYYMKYLRWKNS